MDVFFSVKKDERKPFNWLRNKKSWGKKIVFRILTAVKILMPLRRILNTYFWLEKREGLRNTKLTIAMPKGRIFEEALDLLRNAGFQLPPEFDDSRKLILDVEEENMRFILAKPMDVATYVEHGVADVGIAGKDVMLEEERDVYELLDLKISACYLAVAGFPDTNE